MNRKWMFDVTDALQKKNTELLYQYELTSKLKNREINIYLDVCSKKKHGRECDYPAIVSAAG